MRFKDIKEQNLAFMLNSKSINNFNTMRLSASVSVQIPRLKEFY